MEKKITSLNVRYSLDFQFMPDLFYSTPADFFNAIEMGKEDFLCNIFNNFYRTANKTIFKDNPKIFKPEDFKITKYLLSKSKFLYYIELPLEHDDSRVWCKAYGIGFDLKIAEESTLYFFTVEETMHTKMLCGIDADGLHCNYGDATDDIETNVDKMLKLMFKA